MTSEGLKRLSEECVDNDDPHGEALFQIAYQLAKMNERMDKEDAKFFGGLPSEKEKKVQTSKSRDEGTKQD